MVGPVKVLATPAMPPPTGWLPLLLAVADGGWRGVVRILLIKFTAWFAGAAFPLKPGWLGLTGLTGLIAIGELPTLLLPLLKPLLAFTPLFAGLLGSGGTFDCGWAGGVEPVGTPGTPGKETPGGSVCVPNGVCGLEVCELNPPGAVWNDVLGLAVGVLPGWDCPG